MDPVQEVELILALLAALAGLSIAARRLRVPYPILFFLGGSVLGLLPGVPEVTVPPDLVLLLFLPPLIYSAAVFTSPSEVRRNLRPIAILAVGLVVATTVVVATVAQLAIPAFPLDTAFVLGAIVSATDVTAVLAMVQGLHLPRRIVTILEAEGLFNDATGLVLYQMAVGAVLTGTFSLVAAGPEFLATILGGLVIGLAIGWLAAWMRRHAEDPFVDITITLLTPFTAWIPAEQVGVSGAVAVATAGIYIGQRRYSQLPAATRLMATSFWRVIAFILEGLLFILTGLQVRPSIEGTSGQSLGLVIWYAAAISITVILMRIVWVFGSVFLVRWWAVHHDSEDADIPDWRSAAVVSWAGLRGGESLALGLALPLTLANGATFTDRHTVILLTLGVIFSTMVLQGLSLPLLVRRLEIRGNDGVAPEELAALRQTYEAALTRLRNAAAEGWAPTDSVESMRNQFEHQLRDLSEGMNEPDRARHAAHRRLRQELIDARRREAVRLRDRGDISDEILHRIERALDLEEVQISEQGERDPMVGPAHHSR